MAFYGKRRYNPAADERRAREERDRARIERDRARLNRILLQVRRVPLKGAAAQHAWGQKEIRHFTVGKTSDGSSIITTIRAEGSTLYLQELDGMGWKFSRLVPKHHVLRHEEESERDRSRRPIRLSDLDGLAKRAKKKISDFSPRSLAKGIVVEMEHTRSKVVARRIAMDHLTEDPRYYTKLAKMEAPAARRDPEYMIEINRGALWQQVGRPHKTRHAAVEAAKERGLRSRGGNWRIRQISSPGTWK